MDNKIWLITGASRGFGRVWAEAALARGDKVAACVRNTDSVSDLLATHGDAVMPVSLDVTDRDEVFRQFAAVQANFGRIDVVVNNAGYGLFGAIEETTERQARELIEVNLFGALWVIQAALPLLREQGGGHILSTSSMGGLITFPALGLYHASKWALEAINETLSKETGHFGIKVTLIEPGAFATDWAGESAVHTQVMDEYGRMRKERPKAFSTVQRGDPGATAKAILQVVDAREPPLRLILGDHALPLVRQAYDERLSTWEEWEAVSNAAQGND